MNEARRNYAPTARLVEVECYAGYRAEETPRRWRLGTRQIEIADVVDRWQTPHHRYFKVRDTDGELFVLRLCVTGENEQPFRKVANRDFGRSRTPISDEAEQSFRLMPNTHFG